eukprot:CAMPEP_0181137620 /NCGR_PEP_ID=MMETSP1071-20121207/33799_1 /TAXON_ID=35127 /ORGANISM="Thalassiosira sp., Strain NH16" /LENGTH=414 /DNA_ID=CAMNT_0023224379 /DNA_START=71 /DNA_END=1315 /DNA_ORIENTATION=-
MTRTATASANSYPAQMQSRSKINTIYKNIHHHPDCLSLKFMVTVICAFGMIVASVLNGFGCASLPHSNLVGAFLEPTPISVISKVEDDCRYAMKALEEKRWMLDDGMMQQQPTLASSARVTTRSSPSCSYTPSRHKQPAEKQRLDELREEVVFLESLVGDMVDDIDEMKQSQRLALAARTSLGRIKYALGLIFSVVLVIRVILAAKSFLPISGGDHGSDRNDNDGVIKSFDHSRDPLTSVSLWLLGRNIVSAEQYDLFRQATSLVLAGVLSASQVRAFFRVVGALGRKLSRTCGVGCAGAVAKSYGSVPGRMAPVGGGDCGNNAALLLASFVMGCYFLACAVVIKMNLPMEYRSSFSTAVGLNFNFTKLLNMIFFGSACVSAATLASLFGIQRNNLDRYRLDSQLSTSASLQLA